MKKLILAFVAMAVSVGAVAQVKARWGSIDVRYPVDCETPASDEAVNRAVAWRGERVNLQLVVENGAKESSVVYRFGDLKCGRSVSPAANVVGGFVQPVLTDKFTGCGRHEVDAYGEVPVADRITAATQHYLLPEPVVAYGSLFRCLRTQSRECTRVVWNLSRMAGKADMDTPFRCLAVHCLRQKSGLSTSTCGRTLMP